MIKYSFSLTNAANEKHLRAQKEFKDSLDAAQTAPLKCHSSLPFDAPTFFCPGIVQREFVVAELGDCIDGRRVTHLATQHVSSCNVLVLHADGDVPVTGLAHFDGNTNFPETIDAMLAEFPVRPSRAEIYSSGFHQALFDRLITDVSTDVERAKKVVKKMDDDRWNDVLILATVLFDRYIPVNQIKLDAPHSTFIVDVEGGVIWGGKEPPQSIFHHRDTDSVLADFFGSGQQRMHKPAVNPYGQLMQKARPAVAQVLAPKNQ